MFQIEKNVPVPAAAMTRVGGEAKYPLASMEPGDSFFVPLETEEELQNPSKIRTRIYNSAREFARKKADGRKFFAALEERQVGYSSEEGEGQVVVKVGVRVWRLEDEPSRPE